MRYTFALDIRAPIEKVFAFIYDPDKLKLWLERLEETRYVGEFDAQNPVGKKFKQKMWEGGRLQEYDGEVTACARPKHLGVRLFIKGFTIQVDYRLTPVTDGTR